MKNVKIQSIWIFTNRNALFFDENGEQLEELQRLISFSNEKLDENVLLHLMDIVTNQNPKIYISRWKDWYNEINVDEFFALLGYGYKYSLYKEGLKNEQ